MGEIGSGDGSSYPAAIDTDASSEVNQLTVARAEVPNDLASGMVAVQTTLGINPHGSVADVKTFLQTEHNTDGTHKENLIDHDALLNFVSGEHFLESSIDHTAIANIGTNAHSVIDTHLASTSNPHSVTATQVSLGNVNNSSTTNGLWELSGGNTQLKTADDVNFANLKAIAMVADNGATLPTSGITTGQWFLHTPTGRSILYMYNGNNWISFISLGSMTVHVDTANGTDSLDNGFGVTTDAFATRQFAYDTIPPTFGGNVIIQDIEEVNSEDFTLQGKAAAGNFTITIQGVFAEQLSEKTVSSATSGSNIANGTLTVSGQTWTVGTVEDSGTTDGTAANKLIQSGQNFVTTVRIGMKVKNTTDDTWAHITAIDSDTQLSLDADIMVSGETYNIGWGQFKGQFIQFEDDTTTSALQGNIYLIKEHISDTLIIVGVWVAGFGTTPLATDTFTIQKPASEYTGQIIARGGQKAIIFDKIKSSRTVDAGPSIHAIGDASVNMNFCDVAQGQETFSQLILSDCYIRPTHAPRGLFFFGGSGNYFRCLINGGQSTFANVLGIDISNIAAASSDNATSVIENCRNDGVKIRGNGSSVFFVGANLTKNQIERCNDGIDASDGGQMNFASTTYVIYTDNITDNNADAATFGNIS